MENPRILEHFPQQIQWLVCISVAHNLQILFVQWQDDAVKIPSCLLPPSHCCLHLFLVEKLMINISASWKEFCNNLENLLCCSELEKIDTLHVCMTLQPGNSCAHQLTHYILFIWFVQKTTYKTHHFRSYTKKPLPLFRLKLAYFIDIVSAIFVSSFKTLCWVKMSPALCLFYRYESGIYWDSDL